MSTWKKWQTRNERRSNSTFTRVGEIAQRMFPQVNQENQKGGEIAAFTYGNVWSRIWRNSRQDGTHYYRISLNRIDVKNGETFVRNNFTPSDLNDLIRAARRCQIWLSETHK